MPVSDQADQGKVAELARGLTSFLSQQWQRPGVRAVGQGIAGAALLRAATGFGLNHWTDMDEYDKARYKNAATIIGALAGSANPMLRDFDYGPLSSATSSFFNRLAHRASAGPDLTPFMPVIPVQQSVSLVNDDLFLRPFEKKATIDVIRAAPGSGPATSQYNLVRSALRAGAAFVPAYAFGSLVGHVLGVPKDTARDLSRMGALAYAVRASGIMEQL